MKRGRKTPAAGLMAAMAMAVILLAAGGVRAAGPDNPVDLTVTVTIQKLPITATFRDAAADTFGLGTVAAGSENLITDPITVTNSGNVTETYTLGMSAEPNGSWTSVLANPGSEEYQMAGVFRAPAAAAPGTGDYVDAQDDYSVATSRTAEGGDLLAVNADAGGAGTKGYQMATGEPGNIYLWLKFHAPSTTAIVAEQSIVTSITATTP